MKFVAMQRAGVSLATAIVAVFPCGGPQATGASAHPLVAARHLPSESETQRNSQNSTSVAFQQLNTSRGGLQRGFNEDNNGIHAALASCIPCGTIADLLFNCSEVRTCQYLPIRELHHLLQRILEHVHEWHRTKEAATEPLRCALSWGGGTHIIDCGALEARLQEMRWDDFGRLLLDLPPRHYHARAVVLMTLMALGSVTLWHTDVSKAFLEAGAPNAASVRKSVIWKVLRKHDNLLQLWDMHVGEDPELTFSAACVDPSAGVFDEATLRGFEKLKQMTETIEAKIMQNGGDTSVLRQQWWTDLKGLLAAEKAVQATSAGGLLVARNESRTTLPRRSRNATNGFHSHRSNEGTAYRLD